MRFCFHISGSPGTEDNGCKVKAEHGRRIKPRHKFTKDEQKTLKQLFENNPYPDSQTKDKLAQHFKCQVYVIENWFQNKRSRLSPTLKGKNFAIKRPHKSQDCMRTGHQDTQAQAANHTTEQVSSVQVAPWSLTACSVEIQEASGSHDSEIQSIGTRSSGAAWHQGTSGSGSPLNFTPTNFAPPPMGDWPKTWRSQCSMSSVLGCVSSVQGQWRMDGNYSLLSLEQQQNNWGDQPPLPLRGDLGHQDQFGSMPSAFGCVPSVQGQWQMDGNYSLLFPEQQKNNRGDQPPLPLRGDLGHQDQFGPSNGDAAGSQVQPAPLQEAVRASMPFWLDGQQGAANSCVYCPAGDGCRCNQPSY
ncbi:uncharacterized protein LOC107403024 [Peromyscus maniculatus bairdii]|uniref:uncharacterized protein LOC107403024 n=1 Tax=Peromyscus maniculatus bairdii TaxID=230844 RepID=UPI003FD203CD